jgi:hypothetical protein
VHARLKRNRPRWDAYRCSRVPGAQPSHVSNSIGYGCPTNLKSSISRPLSW